MATLKSNVISNSSFVDKTVTNSPTLQTTINNLTESTSPLVQSLVRHFDLSTLDRFMNAALMTNGQTWSKQLSTSQSKLITSGNEEKKSAHIRKNLLTRVNSAVNPRSSVSDYEEMNEEQLVFINVPINEQLTSRNSMDENVIDNSTCESNEQSTDSRLLQDSRSDEDEDSSSTGNLNNLNTLVKSVCRRKSSSRLARQTGGPAKKFSCHLCQFVTENKPEYNAHMDKHYEHRCSRCGYGCRTKGRLNRHIRESHPDLAQELGCGDGKRKKRNFATMNSDGLSRVSYRNASTTKQMKREREDCFASIDLSDAGSNSTIISERNNQSTPLNDSSNQQTINNQNNNQTINSKCNQDDLMNQNSETTLASSMNSQYSNSVRITSSPDLKIGDNLTNDQTQQSRPSSTDDLCVSNDQSNIHRFRKYTCKQCNHVSMSKKESWEHNKVHINKDKILTCPKCDFTTGFKHHLEYHLRCHFKSKPYKCIKCNYSCINKSMLASHLKSHSNVYQYRCNDCAYATKYCHSLKLHLRKYQHKPDKVLNLDGSENPYPIIDVYGTRRGPRPKKGVGSLKLVKQVLEDNDHVVVDKEKVEKIVNTLAEQNPEDGDDKLFRLMRSNEEREARVDQQLNYIIGEQLKTNANSQIGDECSMMNQIGSSIKSILNQHQQSINKNQSSTKIASKSQSSGQSSSGQFAKERSTCSSTVLNRLTNYCRSTKKSDGSPTQASQEGNVSNEQERVQSLQDSKLLFNDLFTNETGLPTALARSLFSPSLLNNQLMNPSLLNGSLLKEKEQQSINSQSQNQSNILNPFDLYPAHLITNQLLHNHLIAQQAKESTKNEMNIIGNNLSNNLITQLAFNLALNHPNASNNLQTNLNSLLLNSISNSSQQEWNEQVSNQLISQSLLNPTLLNQLNMLNPVHSNLLNQNLLTSTPFKQVNNQILQNSTAGLLLNNNNNQQQVNDSKNLATSMIANWQSYLTSLLLNKANVLASNGQKSNSSLSNNGNNVLLQSTNDNQLSTTTNTTATSNSTSTSTNNASTTNTSTVQMMNNTFNILNNQVAVADERRSTDEKYQKAASITKSNSSQPDLSAVLNSIGQVFNGQQTNGELDLSTILGCSVLMKQFVASNSNQSKKTKENS